MLILERKIGQSIRIGGQVWVTVTAIEPGRCRLAVEAPPGVLVLRGELADRPRGGNVDAADLASAQSLFEARRRSRGGGE